MKPFFRLLLLCSLPLLCHAREPAHPPAKYEQRDDVRAFIAEMQSRNGFDCAELTQLFAQAKSLPAVIQAIKPPADPRIRSWQTYRSRFVEPKRIAAGVKFWQAHPATLARAQALYGVPREIIVGIIGVETIYGRNKGNFQTFSALTTLAFDYPPRAALFRKELEQLLLLARDEKRDPLDYRGSFAGAIGLPQFLPSSIRQWAVDFDKDGKIDLTNSEEDAIGSVAHYLSEHGWQQDGPVLANARAEGPRIAELLAEGIKPVRPVTQLAEFGVSGVDAPDVSAVSAPMTTPPQPSALATPDTPATPTTAISATATTMPASPETKVSGPDTAPVVVDAASGPIVLPAALIDYVTPDAPTEYRLGYPNFYVITRYNKSTFYATSVYELGRAVKAALPASDNPIAVSE